MKTLLRFIAFALIISLLPAASFVSAASHQTEVPTTESPEVSTVTWEDVYAGIADPRTMYDPLDPSTVPAIIGYETAYKRAHVQRLYAEEGSNLNTIIFLNANQTKTVYLFDHPVKYVDENGNIKDITLDITGEVGSSGTFRTESNSVLTTFSRNLTDGISLNSNGLSVTMTPLLPQELNSKSDTSTATATTLSAALATKLSDETVSYNYDAKTTIEYALTYTGFKEDIVVSEYTGQTTYDFILETNGLTLEENNGSFYLTDNDGNIRANIGDIIIFTADEQNNTLGWLTAKTITANQKYLLTVNVEENFLKDEKTAYPIRIDPTLEINFDNNGSGAIEDVTINSLEGSSGSSGSLFIGKRETYGISRVLMKFPGLDLTQISNSYNIESAIVEIRDILGGSDELVVNCHMFTGNAWTESTANWSTVDPNNYSEIISTNTVSYSIGTALPTAHRYQFDITQAVRGWMANSDSQNSGIVFKATDEAENSATYLHKTFASFNRSSYKPSFTITYSTDGQISFQSGTYYINNLQHGKYLKHEAALALESGYISELGNSIRWDIQRVPGGYVIRSSEDPTKYLGVSSGNSLNIIYYTIEDSVIPLECIWRITSSDLGGCLIKSVAKSVQQNLYLYCSGNVVYLRTLTEDTQSYFYRSCTWRVANTSFYGNTSDHSAREFSERSCFQPFSNYVAFSENLTLSKGYSNEAWCNLSDFTYSSSSPQSVSVSNNGVIIGYTAGEYSIRATHKVTNRVLNISVSVNPLLIYRTRNRESLGFEDPSDESDVIPITAEDFTYGTKSTQTILNEGTSIGLVDLYENNYTETQMTIENRATIVKNFFNSQINYDPTFMAILDQMVDKVVSGTGGYYSDADLTAAVVSHPNTTAYKNRVSAAIQALLESNSGNITSLFYDESLWTNPPLRETHPVVSILLKRGIKEPVYTFDNGTPGLTLCLDSLYGNKIEVVDYYATETGYSGKLKFTFYDHFGLGRSDLATKKYGGIECGYFEGFRQWYILQHWEDLDCESNNDTHPKPFITQIVFTVEFSGGF